MLVSLTRQKFEQLIPLIATGNQYKYYWGKFPDFLRRLLVSVSLILLLLLAYGLLGWEYAQLLLFIGIFGGLYWLWAPVLLASWRNFQCRQFKYSGFWRGEVLDVFITEELVGKEQTVNKRGELVIVENRERRLNIDIGDETGFSTQLQVPLRREHKAIRPGQIAEMTVMSNRPDLSRITKVTDIFLPDLDLWVSDYPYLRRDEFAEVSRRLEQGTSRDREEKPRKRSRKPPRRNDER